MVGRELDIAVGTRKLCRVEIELIVGVGLMGLGRIESVRSEHERVHQY